jgi:FKBP12-rapamycin complex-associated protein
MPAAAALSQVRPALGALRALGPVLEDHLALLLPALVRLVSPGGTGTPITVQEEALSAMQDLLCRMQLAGALLPPWCRRSTAGCRS